MIDLKEVQHRRRKIVAGKTFLFGNATLCALLALGLAVAAASDSLSPIYAVHNEDGVEAIRGNGVIDADEHFIFGMEGTLKEPQTVPGIPPVAGSGQGFTVFVTVSWKGAGAVRLLVETPAAYEVFDGVSSESTRSGRTACVKHVFANRETRPVIVTAIPEGKETIRHVRLDGIVHHAIFPWETCP